MKNSVKGKNILFGITGSIAAYKACDILSGLRKAGANVSVIMTEHACEFITPLTVQTISGSRVYLDMFEGAWQPEHIHLSDWGDILVIAPATADIIAKMACGIADELLTSTVLAFRKPVLLAPAMNENMYNNPITQGNVKKLQKNGILFVPPEKGRLASGATGIGRLARAESILKKVEEILLKT